MVSSAGTSTLRLQQMSGRSAWNKTERSLSAYKELKGKKKSWLVTPHVQWYMPLHACKQADTRPSTACFSSKVFVLNAALSCSVSHAVVGALSCILSRAYKDKLKQSNT